MIQDYFLSIIWFIFVALFFYMSWRERERSMRPMKSLESSFFQKTKIIMGGVNFESFARELEKANQESHKIASVAYFLAGVTALASLIFSL